MCYSEERMNGELRLDPPKEIIVDHCRGCLLEIYVGDDCLETDFGPIHDDRYCLMQLVNASKFTAGR